MSSQLPFTAFDADNHYYEAEDAFLRHMDERVAHRGGRAHHVLLDFARLAELPPKGDACGVRRRDRGRGALLGVALVFEPRDICGALALVLREQRARRRFSRARERSAGAEERRKRARERAGETARERAHANAPSMAPMPARSEF